MNKIKTIISLLLMFITIDIGNMNVVKYCITDKLETTPTTDDIIISIEKLSNIKIPNYIDGNYIIFAYETANEYNIPIDIAFRLIYTESRFKIGAMSSVGAKGLMQVMPKTFDYHVNKNNINLDNLDDVEMNIKVGMSILKYQYERFGSWKNALIAYNAGASYVYENKELPSNTEYYYKFILNENKS